MLITLAVAVFFSWLAVQIKEAKDETRAVAAIRAIGGSAYHCQSQRAPSGRKWLRKILGEEFFAEEFFVGYPHGATDADLEHLDAIRCLTRLWMSGSATTPAGRARLWDREELIWLGLQSNSITDEELAAAASLTKLEYLGLSHTPITDCVVDTLRRLPALEDCLVDGTLVSDGTIEWVARSLQGPGNPETGPTMAPAPSQEHQRAAAAIERAGGYVRAFRPEGGGEVYYDATCSLPLRPPGSDELIERLRRLKDLRRLDLSASVPLDRKGWKRLTRAVPDLTSLRIRTDSATDDAMKHVAELDGLKTLTIRSHQLTDAGLAHLGKMASLERLDIGGPFTDAGLAHMADLKNLRHLRIYTYWNLAREGPPKVVITDAGLVHLKSLKNLRRCVLGGTNVTPEGRADFERHLAGQE